MLNKNFNNKLHLRKFLKMNSKPVKGFSKLSKEAKMEWIADEYLGGDDKCINLLKAIGMKTVMFKKFMMNSLKTPLPIFISRLE